MEISNESGGQLSNCNVVPYKLDENMMGLKIEMTGGPRWTNSVKLTPILHVVHRPQYSTVDGTA